MPARRPGLEKAGLGLHYTGPLAGALGLAGRFGGGPFRVLVHPGLTADPQFGSLPGWPGPELQGAAERFGQPEQGCGRFPPEAVEDLLELIIGAEGQVEEEAFSAFDFAGASAASAKPLVADLVAQALGRLEGLLQQLDGVHLGAQGELLMAER